MDEAKRTELLRQADHYAKVRARRAACPHANLKPYGDGMCYEGCCDRYECVDCGKIITVEGAD